MSKPSDTHLDKDAKVYKEQQIHFLSSLYCRGKLALVASHTVQAKLSRRTPRTGQQCQANREWPRIASSKNKNYQHGIGL